MQDDIDRDKSGRPISNIPRGNVGMGGSGGGPHSVAGSIGGSGNVGGGGGVSGVDLRNNSRMPVADDFQWDNTYGLSPQFLESLNIRGPLINRIFVANVNL